MGLRIMTESHFALGNDYARQWNETAIGRVNIDSRKKVFNRLLKNLEIVSVLEVGSGLGHNLFAISCLGNYALTGIDNLDYAVSESQTKYGSIANIKQADCSILPYQNSSFDMVLACGFLDWIDCSNLPAVVNEITRVSSRYILIIDYCMFNKVKPLNDDTELLAYYKGFPLYWIRDYKCRMPDCTLVRTIGKLPRGFSLVTMSALLFEKERKK